MRIYRSLVLACSLTTLLVVSACGGSPAATLRAVPTTLEVPHGAARAIQLTWLPKLERGDEALPRVFVHLIGAEGQIVRTFDHDLPASWRVGEEISYRLVVDQSQLGPAVVGGSYPLRIGLYDTGGRLPVASASGGGTGRWVEAATVEAAPFGGPGLVDLAAEWTRIEVGDDRQILGRTWLRGRSGGLTFERVPSGAALWLMAHIPDREHVSGQLFVDGDALPRVEVTSGCGLDGASAEGFGTHELELVPLPPAVPGELLEGPCELTVTTSFSSVAVGGGERSVMLEKVAWLATE